MQRYNNQVFIVYSREQNGWVREGFWCQNGRGHVRSSRPGRRNVLFGRARIISCRRYSKWLFNYFVASCHHVITPNINRVIRRKSNLLDSDKKYKVSMITSLSIKWKKTASQIARFMAPTWAPMSASWTLLSGMVSTDKGRNRFHRPSMWTSGTWLLTAMTKTVDVFVRPQQVMGHVKFQFESRVYEPEKISSLLIYPVLMNTIIECDCLIWKYEYSKKPVRLFIQKLWMHSYNNNDMRLWYIT